MEYDDFNNEELSTAQSYRLQNIYETEDEITQECDKRTALCTKYRRNIRIISVIDNTLMVTVMGLSSSGLGVLTAVIAAPAIAIATGTAVGVGLLIIIGGQVNKKLVFKVAKHEKIKTLAEAKLNTISSLISKALMDDNVSDEEYSLILNEFVKFNEMKEAIRSKSKLIERNQKVQEITLEITLGITLGITLEITFKTTFEITF